jgi:acyl-coenzyme A synthetase/AMP-(fatty) acid ligase
VISRGGIKFYPVEIETVLQTHESVVEAAVLGRRQEGADDDVVAFVVAQGEHQIGELVAHCRVHLATHKIPRRIRFVSQLPRLASGKVDKAALAKVVELNP